MYIILHVRIQKFIAHGLNQPDQGRFQASRVGRAQLINIHDGRGHSIKR